MNQRIIYPNDEGGVAIVIPSGEVTQVEYTAEEQAAYDAAVAAEQAVEPTEGV
jgi:hypothetical protein